ncbi:MAG: response regulator [Chloroflexi bacterium]|nr:response regulator [Chloroflexota bacterium]
MANEKVLVVDDSPTDLALMCAPLRASGFVVTTAIDGEEAIEKACKEMPRVIVLDIVLPKKNGYQVCRSLKNDSRSKGIPIIMLSGRSQPSDKFWGLKQGADEYLVKPFDGEQLVSAVKRFL